MDNLLRQLQLTQLEMLKVVDQICKENDIHYSLYAGTLLGAVRHGGFIPWDDDLDICMPRDDYRKFLELWPKVKREGYILQNKENTPNFTQSFTKIRKDHTTFLQDTDERGRYHTGIFIDIFPIDRIPDGKLKRYLFYWNCMRYQLLTREFVPQQYGRIKKVVSQVILSIIPNGKRMQERERLLAKIVSNDYLHELETVGIETVNSMHISFPSDMLDSYTTIQFEDSQFMCFTNWDDHLHCKYGNYMSLPPEEERVWKHHPILIDFEHNYEELINQQ